MRLNYVEHGQGTPVVLLHGMFGSLTNLGGLARALSDSYRVISCDLRNQGDSFHSDVMDLQSMSEDLVTLLDYLDIEATSVVGHSLGGKVGMQFALNYSDRCSNLVVADISPVAYAPKHDLILEALVDLSKDIIYDRAAADKLLARHIHDRDMRSFLLKNISKSNNGAYQIKINLKVIEKNYYTNLVAAPKGDPFESSTLFLKGEKSAYIQEKHKSQIGVLFPNYKLKILDECGHWLHVQKPELFNTLIEQFLDGAEL